MNLVKLAPHLAGPCAYGVHMSRGTYWDAPHVRLISDAFRRCALKPGGRLMIITPPRHGKSTTASHYGPQWYLNLFPERRVLFGSYAAHFAGNWGEKVRNGIKENGARYVQLGARTMRQDWVTTKGGGMRSVGTGGVAGQGAHLLIMDDTVAGQQDALSPTIQESTWAWWLADFSTRKESPDASIVAIGTRWSERDLLGRLIAAYEEGPGAEGYENWEILYLPAIYDGFDWTGRRPYVDPMGRKVGEALWDRWPVEWLKQEEARKPWWFAALFQGRPQPLEGGIFKQGMWPYWRAPGAEYEDLGPVVVAGDERQSRPLPAIVRALISVDANFLADMADLAKGRQRSDVAVHVLGLDAHGNKYVLDRKTEMLDIRGTAKAVLVMRKRYAPGSPRALALGLDLPPMVALIEAKANGPAVMARLRRRGVVCIPVTPVEGKVARVVGRGDNEAQRFGRATALLDDVQAGKVLLPHPGMVIEGRSYAWALDLRHKLAQFPKAGSDDTDALSQGWSRLESIDWDMAGREQQAARQSAEKAMKVAGLPPGTPMPTSTKDLLAARSKAIVDKRLDALAKRISRRRLPFGR